MAIKALATPGKKNTSILFWVLIRPETTTLRTIRKSGRSMAEILNLIFPVEISSMAKYTKPNIATTTNKINLGRSKTLTNDVKKRTGRIAINEIRTYLIMLFINLGKSIVYILDSLRALSQ